MIIGNHPENEFPCPGVACLRPGYLPSLTNLTLETASELEESARHIGAGVPAAETWARLDETGPSSFVLLWQVPPHLRVSATEETWVIVRSDHVGVSAVLYDSWDAASDFHSLTQEFLAADGPGALIAVRHGYRLHAHHLTGELRWFRPYTWDEVPHCVQVTTDQLPDDPGIRAWREARTELGIAGEAVCGLIAPELMAEALVGYQELAHERGITLQSLRNDVSRKAAAPTLPDTGARWTRAAALPLVAGEPSLTWHVTTSVFTPGDEHPAYETAATGLTEDEALEYVARLRAEAEARGIKTRDGMGGSWVADGWEATDLLVSGGGVGYAAVGNNLAELHKHPAPHRWRDPILPAVAPEPTRRRGRRGKRVA